MEAVRRLVPVILFTASCLAKFNSTKLEGPFDIIREHEDAPRSLPGQSSCKASLGGTSQSDAHRSLILQLKPDDDCVWTVHRPENKAVRVVFSHVQLDPDASCESEHIQVFDGNSTRGPLLGRVCSKHDYVPVFASTSNTLTVQIATGPARVPRTVFIFYYSFSPDAPIPHCGGFLDAPTGSFTSPNYPQPHPEMAYCTWHIRVEEGYKIQLSFREIFLEVDENCRFDFLAVYDGASTTSGLMAQVCGRVTPTFESSSNSLTVVLSTDYANSYRGFSASYTSVYGEPVNTTSLICSSEKMRIILSKSYLESFNYKEDDVQLMDPMCRPTVSNVVEFSIPLNGCGTIKKVEAHSIAYTNVVTLAAAASQVITRQKRLQVVARCELEHNITVETVYVAEDDVVQRQDARGNYNTSMALFESSSFEKPVLEAPYYVDLNQSLFVQVSLHTSDPNLVVFLHTCRAAPTPAFAAPTYDLIESGCKRDETCEVYPLSEHHGRFQFNAFKFLRHLGSVYLQCKVLICDSGDHQSRCSQGCVSRRRRDVPSYRWKAEAVLGPIRLKRDRGASGDSGFQPPGQGGGALSPPLSSLHLFAFAVLALNTVAVAVAVARHVVTRRADHGYQKLQDY